MNSKSIHISIDDFDLFLLSKSYDFYLSEIERKIFMDKYAHALEINFIAESRRYPVKKIEELFDWIHYFLDSNNTEQTSEFNKKKARHSNLGNTLLIEFIKSSERRLSTSRTSETDLTYSKKEKFCFDSENKKSLYKSYFKKVSSVTEFALAINSLQEELINATHMNNQEEYYDSYESNNALLMNELYNILPKIVKRLASISHFSERDICLNLINSLKTVNTDLDKELQDRIDRSYSYRINYNMNIAAIQKSTSIYRYTDKLPPQDIPNTTSNELNTITQNEKNQVDYNSFQDAIKHINNLAFSLERLHRKQSLTLSRVIEENSNISAYFPFHKLDLYAVYCFVKRSIVAFNLTNSIRLEEVIALGYLYCLEEIQAGIIFNDITNYLKQKCYKAIIEFYEEFKEEHEENHKIRKFQQLDSTHKKRFIDQWNKQIESLLKKCWSEIEIDEKIFSKMTQKGVLLPFVGASQAAISYCNKLIDKLGYFDSELEDILNKSIDDPFVAIWIDECDYLLADKLELIEEDEHFIYSSLVANVNKYINENFNSSLPIFSCDRNLLPKERIKVKLENRLELLKKFTVANHKQQQDKQSTLKKQNSFFFLTITSSIINKILDNLHSYLSAIFSIGIMIGTMFYFFINQSIVYNSTKQTINTKDSTEFSKKSLDNENHKVVDKGIATWHGGDKKQETTNSELFNVDLKGFSLYNFPPGRQVRITNTQNKKSADFKINNSVTSTNITNRIINVSKLGAKKLGFVKEGIAPVTIEVCSPKPE